MGKASKKKKEQKITAQIKEASTIADASKVSLIKNPVFHVILIALIGLAVYSNTFNAPFQWDEPHFIIDNPFIRDFGYLTGISKSSQDHRYIGLQHRFIGYLSFTINYKIHGFDVTGFHIFNIAIHIGNALLIYFIVSCIFKVPLIITSAVSKYSNLIALFTALFFVTHPVQTEAITYIFQRLASLVTLFYLSSFLFFILSRLAENKKSRYFFYSLSLLSAILAMKTKENAFTLPFAIALFDFLFFKDDIRKRIIFLTPILITSLIIPLSYIGINQPIHDMLGKIDPTSYGTKAIGWKEYLYTQFSIIVTYLRLLVLPINQNLDYNYPLYQSLFEPRVIVSFLFLTCVFLSGLYLIHLSRKKDPILRLIGFGIIWFFLTLSVESSVIPIQTIIDEYRIYLPSFGFFIATVPAVFICLIKFPSKGVRISLLVFTVSILLCLSYAAYMRNDLWSDNVKLWEDTVKKSPGKTRPLINLVKAYIKQERFDDALRVLLLIVKQDTNNMSYYADSYTDLAGVYLKLNRPDEAIKALQKVIELTPNDSGVYGNIAGLYIKLNKLDEALVYLKKALELNPDFAAIHSNLGALYERKGMLNDAAREFQTAINLDPGLIDAHYNLGVVYLKMDMPDKTIDALKSALKLNAQFMDARILIAQLLAEKKQYSDAVEHLNIALKINPSSTHAHNALGAVYMMQGNYEAAAKHFKETLSLNPDDTFAKTNLNTAYERMKSKK